MGHKKRLGDFGRPTFLVVFRCFDDADSMFGWVFRKMFRLAQILLQPGFVRLQFFDTLPDRGCLPVSSLSLNRAPDAPI